MSRIKNIEEVIIQLKPLLRKYLVDQGTIFRGSLFQCPNRKEHSNNDNTPSAGFVPNTEEQIFNCFGCGSSSDIFGAYKFLEDKEINGAYWYSAVRELADRYGITYELEPLKPEEQEFNNVQTFLKTLIKNANKYLVEHKPEMATKYIKQRGWEGVVEKFELGTLPDNQRIKEFIIKAFKEYPEISKYLTVNLNEPKEFAAKIVNRLLYPIKHRYGYILGIIDRAISDKDVRPKYKKHYLKSYKEGMLFNLSKTFKSVYVVEGASSVFTLYLNNIKNVISILGADSFTEAVYNNLIKHGVDKLILCLDGDEAGSKAVNRILKLTQNKSDIKIFIKELPKDKDPDDLIRELGVEFFTSIPEVSSFKYQLNKYVTIKEDNSEKDELKKSLFEIIISSKDAILRERMLKLFAQQTGLLKTVLIEEIEKYERNKGILSTVGVGELLREKEVLVEVIEKFEERAWRSGRLKGIPTGFPIFDEKIDGLQTGLVLVAGKWNTGKSAFMQSIALNLLNDPTNYVLYFSIDDPVIGSTIPRFVANLSQIPINVISNPLYKIDKNETLDEATKLTLRNKRNEAIKLLKECSGRLGLKDSTDGYNTSFIERLIKVYRLIAGDKKLVVFVDFLNMVKLDKKNIDRTETETLLAGLFKHMAGLYDIPVICTVESTKGVADSVMHEGNIKGSSAIQFRSDLTLLLSSDFESSKSNMHFYDNNGEAQPVVQVHISKNKMSGFKKFIYYKFYREFSKFEECTFAEQMEFGRR